MSSAFRPIVTPVHAAVDNQNADLADQTSDIVDGVTQSPALNPAPSLQLDLSGNKPVTPPSAQKLSPTEEVAKRLEEAQRKEKVEEELSKLVRKTRCEQFKERPDASLLARLFLLEMSGVDRFRQTYTAMGGLIKVVFHTPLEADIRLMGQQLMRDNVHNRNVYIQEGQSDAECYRLAASLASIQIVDPKSGKVHNEYRQDTTDINTMKAADLHCLDTDLEPRKRWQYLSQNVITTNYIFLKVRELFNEFELLNAELITMANEDPDFFYEASSSDGSTV